MSKNIYIAKLVIKNYASFKGQYEFDFRDKNGDLNQWTVVLANNNAGKTNFLRAIAGLEPRRDIKQIAFPFALYNEGILPKSDDKLLVEGHFFCDAFLIPDFNAFPKKIEEYNHGMDIGVDINSKYHYFSQRDDNKGGVFGDKYFHENFKLFGYGVTRRSSQESSLSSKENVFNSETLFDANATLINFEEWLLQLDYATKSGNEVAKKQLNKLRELIESDVFPEIKGIHFNFESIKPHVEFETSEGKRRLNGLGYGYQTTLSWIFDLSKKMFECYPDSEHPLREAAVVLIDELDLHLHPQWQREIVKYLSDVFVHTQFIVTTHSPFIIQSIDKINLFVLNKTDEGTTVEKSPFSTFKGWTVEEILDEILGLGDKTRTEEYRRLINAFDEGLDTDDYEKSHAAYEELSKILHPYSSKRKLLEIQLSQLIPND